MQKIALIVSRADTASKLILEKLKELCKGGESPLPAWATLYEFEEDIIHIDLTKVKEADCVFLSRHKSAAGTKSLTVHHLGNFGKADIAGGEEGKLCKTLPLLQALYLRSLAKKNESSGLAAEGFTVSLEVTHHGPFAENKNCLFIELGSSEKEWGNKRAAKVIAEVVLEETQKFLLEESEHAAKDKVVIGVGGGHYAPDFTKLILRQPYAFGHICPKYALEHLNEEMLAQMVEKSGAKEIILDWKGLKEHKEKVMEFCKKTSLPTKRVQDLLGY